MTKETKATEAAEEVAENAPIATVTHEYNREDLNELRDRLNQVIGVVNNLD